LWLHKGSGTAEPSGHCPPVPKDAAAQLGTPGDPLQQHGGAGYASRVRTGAARVCSRRIWLKNG